MFLGVLGILLTISAFPPQSAISRGFAGHCWYVETSLHDTSLENKDIHVIGASVLV